ncbi:DUF916 domain-containing protein [Streptomyces sp. NBC_00335]|uniref:WxL protein peptidoglycan domain-containing protein n=1 Tax=unclassified Streptomyces TaxID=2593676 RepID=UPI002257481A|nr:MULTISPECIES: DUF916 domain-containing protein [unclassified Streptomyces]MCX5410204.1 DUF916 domain-containing protein [Streptomyces sp. NBC_00086]
MTTLRSDRPADRARRAAARALVITAFRAVAACLAALSALAVAGASPATASEAGSSGTGSWSVQPAGTAGRPAFVMDSAPGSVVKDAVRVSNLSDAPLSFQVYGSDAYNTPRDGALAYRQAGEAQSGIGAWITLGTNALVIPPGRAADIPFTVNVPGDVTPGSHIGGIVALNNAVEEAGGASGVDVGIQRAIAVRIQLTVEGPVTPGLAVRSVRVHHHPSGVPFADARTTLTYKVVNTGNTALRPTVSPRLQGLFGLRHSSFAERTLPLLLPGQSAELSTDWPGAPGLDYLTATVRVSAPGMPATSAQSGRVALSWPTLGSVGALLAVLAVALGWIRRAKPGLTGRPL